MLQKSMFPPRPCDSPLGNCKFAKNRTMYTHLLKTDQTRSVWFLLVTLRMTYPEHFFIDTHVYELEDNLMARNNQQWKFINIKLTDKDKKPLAQYADSHKVDVRSVIDDICAGGYKLSISFVIAQNSYVVTVSGNDKTKHNNGCSMTSWSDEVIEAIFMTGYKMFEICGGEPWDEYATENNNWG